MKKLEYVSKIFSLDFLEKYVSLLFVMKISYLLPLVAYCSCDFYQILNDDSSNYKTSLSYKCVLLEIELLRVSPYRG